MTSQFSPWMEARRKSSVKSPEQFLCDVKKPWCSAKHSPKICIPIRISCLTARTVTSARRHRCTSSKMSPTPSNAEVISAMVTGDALTLPITTTRTFAASSAHSEQDLPWFPASVTSKLDTFVDSSRTELAIPTRLCKSASRWTFRNPTERPDNQIGLN